MLACYFYVAHHLRSRFGTRFVAYINMESLKHLYQLILFNGIGIGGWPSVVASYSALLILRK